jgi:membrane protein DedA with SNARE-associated domain
MGRVSTAMTGWVEDALEAGGAPVLTLVMFLENVFPPIPSELVLPLAGFMVAQGTLHPRDAVGVLGLVAAGALVLGLLALWWRVQRAPGREPDSAS